MGQKFKKPQSIIKDIDRLNFKLFKISYKKFFRNIKNQIDKNNYDKNKTEQSIFG